MTRIEVRGLTKRYGPDTVVDDLSFTVEPGHGQRCRPHPPGTRVRIGVGTVAGRAVFEVADDGPGMPADQAERAFNRFYRADRSQTRSDGANAGLGLSIARSLTRAHGGDVELETVLGEGACFRIALPLLD
jgi:two-component system OmpR family sensor kinase